MSLWTDNDFLTSADLMTLDGEIQGVASAENITLDDPLTGNSIIHRAIEEAGDKLMKYLQVFGGYLNSGSVSTNHYNAVMNLGQTSVNRSKIIRAQIVTSDATQYMWSPLKRWVAVYALYVFFRDVANRTQKDRYREKSDNYKHDANTVHWDALRSMGVPTVRMPLPCPGAAWEPGCGFWNDSNLTQVAGPGTLSDAWDFAITWVDLTTGPFYVSPTNKSNAESGPSARLTSALTPGQVVRLNISSLIPPNGSQPQATMPMAIVPYRVAGGWNVYAGPTGGPLYLQNASPLPVATTVYTFTADPVPVGPMLDQGQYTELFLTLPTGIIQRG